MSGNHSPDLLIDRPDSLVFYLGVLILLFDGVTLALRVLATDVLTLLRPEIPVPFPLTNTMQATLAFCGGVISFVGGYLYWKRGEAKENSQ